MAKPYTPAWELPIAEDKNNPIDVNSLPNFKNAQEYVDSLKTKDNAEIFFPGRTMAKVSMSLGFFGTLALLKQKQIIFKAVNKGFFIPFCICSGVLDALRIWKNESQKEIDSYRLANWSQDSH